MSKSNSPIGVFDSGVGGLTVLRTLREQLPYESFIYLGDTARLPYGTKGETTITRYATQATQFLIDHSVKMVVIACNTASALALAQLHIQFPDLPILGVIHAGAFAATQMTKTGSVLVIATEGTTNNRAYEKAIHALNPDIRVFSQACSLFVALAEEGWLSGPLVERIISEYLTPLLKNIEDADTLVLGCTHFPTLRQAIQRVVGHTLQLVDASEMTAHAVKDELFKRALFHSEMIEGRIEFLATDSPERFARVAAHFMGHPLEVSDVKLVDLSG